MHLSKLRIMNRRHYVTEGGRQPEFAAAILSRSRQKFNDNPHYASVLSPSILVPKFLLDIVHLVLIWYQNLQGIFWHARNPTH